MDAIAFNRIRWDNASPAGRQRILNDFFAQVNGILGHIPRYALAFRDLDAGTSGRYNRRTGLITINTRYLQDDSSLQMIENCEEAMFTVIHEARHEFQHNATRSSTSFRVSVETRNHWRDNMNRYVGPRSGVAHFAQPIEWDAWNFEGNAGRIRPVIKDEELVPVYEGSWPW